MTTRQLSFLDMLIEPAFVLSGAGIVLEANKAAHRLHGSDPTGRSLVDLVATQRDKVEIWLRRCSGTAQPLVGAVTLGGARGVNTRFRAYGARLDGQGEPVRIGIRCVPHHSDEFSILARKVRELNAEILARRRTQAVLEESLARNELLLRELHHRVKNNIQMLSGLFSAAQRETRSEEVRRFLADANRRLLAVGAAQQLMYRSKELRLMPAADFLTSLCDAVKATLGPNVTFTVSADDVELSNEIAFPLALIVNELVTNASKHGLTEEGVHVSVSFRLKDEMFMLVVEDSGPGFLPDIVSSNRSSGLGLVRGLCRQISGALEIGTLGHGSCTIRFPAHGP